MLLLQAKRDLEELEAFLDCTFETYRFVYSCHPFSVQLHSQAQESSFLDLGPDKSTARTSVAVF